MALPQIPDESQEAIYQGFLRHLPNNWFHQLTDREGALYPLIWGLSGAIARLQLAYEAAQRQAIPMLSSGVWLSLHLKSIGLERRSNSTDAQAREDYQWEFRQTRNTRAGLLRTIARVTGLTPPRIRLEGDRSLGKLGQFRVVVDDAEKPWSEVPFDFVGWLTRKYVANGIIPGIEIKLMCLLVAPLPAYQFHTPFPNSWVSMGSVWERPAFVTPYRLPFGNSVFAQVTPDEWRDRRLELRKLNADTRSGGSVPGGLFLYLSDQGQCPYMGATMSVPLGVTDPDEVLGDRRWFPDGFQFHTPLPPVRAAAQIVDAPYLEVDAFSPPIPSLTIGNTPVFTPQLEIAIANNSAATMLQSVYFSQLKIARTEYVPPTTVPGTESPQLREMRSGAWELALSEGLPAWADPPPPGTTLEGTPFTVLKPRSLWWTDLAGDIRSHVARWDEVTRSVYLGMEFLREAIGQSYTVREVELRLNGRAIAYRRVSMPVDSDIHFGINFKVRGVA